MRTVESAKLLFCCLTAASLAVGCSSTTQVKGAGRGTGGDGGGGTAGAGGSGDAGNPGGAGGSGTGGSGTGGSANAGGAGGSSGSIGAAGAVAAGGVGGNAGGGPGGASGSGGASGMGGGGAGPGGAAGSLGVGGASGAGGVPAECSVVSCGGSIACCVGTAVFVLDTPLMNYQSRPELVAGFSMTGLSATAQFRFDAAGQRGNVGFDLAGRTDVGSLLVDASYSGTADYPYVGLETDQGARGCAYALLGTDADLTYPLFCWGAPSFLLSETTRVNVRVDSNAVGPATLSVNAVQVN